MITLEDEKLLWASLVYVSLNYAMKKPATQAKRPMQCYEPGDGQRIWKAIREVSRRYDLDKCDEAAGGRKPDFQVSKGIVLQKLMAEGLSRPKRNFYSSVISTFVSWHRYGTIEKRKEVLEIIKSLPQLPDRHKF